MRSNMKFTTFLPKIHLSLELPVSSRTLGEASHGKKTLIWAAAAAVSAVAYMIFCVGFVTAASMLFSPVTTSLLIGIPLAVATITCLALYILSLAAFGFAVGRCVMHVYTLLTEAPIHLD